MVRSLLVFLLAAASAADAATIAVTVAGTTATQAILSYTAPNDNACTIVVSPSASMSPVVNDVNASLFAGANSDNRAGSLISGQSRVVVVGARISALASDGNYYSRALQGLTQYFFSVTCGSSSGSGTFTTLNPPLGNSAPDAVPWIAGPWGNQGWPSMSWTAQNQYIDPLTGLVVERLTGPGQSSQGETSFPAVYVTDIASAWTNPSNILGSSGYASTSATGSANALFIPLDKQEQPGFTSNETFDDVQISIGSAYASGAGGQVSMCLTVNHGQSCVGSIVTAALPDGSGSAAAVAIPPSGAGTGDFTVSPPFGGWGSPKITAEQSTNLNGTISVSGTTATLVSNTGSSTTYFPLSTVTGDHILIAGSAPTCPNNDCTISALVNGSTLTLSHNLASFAGFSTTLSGSISAGATTFTVASASGFIRAFNAGTVPYYSAQYYPVSFDDGNPETVYCSTLTGTTFSGCAATSYAHSNGAAMGSTAFSLTNFGVMIWNSGSGTANLEHATYTIATSTGFSVGVDGSANFCSVGTVTVSYAANGTTPLSPVQTGRTCQFLDLFGNPALFLFIPQTGESRLIAYGDNVKGNNTTGTFSPTDPNTVYYAQNGVSNPNIYQCVYNASAGHYTALSPNYTGAASPNYSCTSITSGAGNDLLSQVHNLTGANTSYFDRVSGFGPLVGNYISITIQLGQGSIGYSCGFDVTQAAGSQIVGCHDTWSTYPERWGGAHGLFAMRTSAGWGAIFLIPLASQGTTGIGLYQFSVNSITGESGTTALTSTVSTDPTTQNCSTLGVTDSRWIALGASGNNCIQMMVATEPQNVAPSSADRAQWPSACNGSYAQLQTIQPGDYLYDNAGDGGYGENFLVALKTGSGCSPITLVLARGVNQTCAPAPQAHLNGWTPIVGATANCNGNEYWFNVTNPGTAYVDNSGTTLGHSYIGQADNTGIDLVQYTVYNAGTSPAYADYGVRQGPLPELIGQGFSYGVNMVYPFNGAQALFSGPGVGINYVQAHPGGQSYLATPNTLGYDGRPLGGAGGGIGTVWNHTYSPVSGQSHTYLISCALTALSGGSCIDSLARKQLGMAAFAGRFMLADISGPGSTITDSNPYTYCIADFAGECVAGSAAGNRYVSVPDATTTGNCIVGALDQNTPCLATVPASVAQATEYNWSAADPNALHWRRLGYAFNGPGQSINYWNVHGIVDASWAITEVDWKEGVRKDIVAIQLPPWAPSDTIIRSQYEQMPIQIGGGTTGDTARIEFGYQEFGAPATLACTTRGEACFTSSSATQSNPFLWASETQAYTSCGSGCTVPIPARPAEVLYYRVHRKNSAGVEVAGPVQALAVQ